MSPGHLDRRAIAVLVLASALWGGALTGTKYALAGFDPFTLLLVELGAATLALWALLLARGFRPPRSWRLAVILGLLEPGIANLAQTFGLSKTNAADGAVVCGLEAAFVVLLAAAVLRERITRATAAAVALAFIGLLVLQSGNPLGGSGLGDLFVAMGVLSGSTYTVVMKRFSQEQDALALTTYQFTAATALALLVVGGRWAAGTGDVPTAVQAKFWLAAALVGICGFAVSFVLFNATISRVKAGSASIVLNSIPLFGVLTALIFLGERLRLDSVLGASLIAISVGCFLVVENRQPVRIQLPEPREEFAVQRSPRTPRFRVMEQLDSVSSLTPRRNPPSGH